MSREPATMSLVVYTREEVKKHCSKDDIWVVIDDFVYDVTDFADAHPGGRTVLEDVAGQDATLQFYSLHRETVLQNPRFASLKIGRVEAMTSKQPTEVAIPYTEAHGTWRRHSPYYNSTHAALRKAVREFIDKEIVPDAVSMDEKGKYPSAALMKLMGDTGILAVLFGSAIELNARVGHTTYLGGVKPKDFDEFHELIVAEEFSRIGCYGLKDGLMGGLAIGLPPILKFGSKDLLSRVALSVLAGDARICLCVSEPWAGSDVAQLKTRATLSPCGQYWVLRGVKKWITGGAFADYFTVLARTDSKKAGHMTMMVVKRDNTVSTKPIPTSYSASAGTAYVEFNDTHVPVSNVIGTPGLGFKYAMANFNKERWGMVVAGNTMSRNMISECFKWANQRKIFGKSLISQPVIRAKLAEMAAEIESVHSFLEDMTYQMMMMTDKEVNQYLAGPIALLKYKQTRVATLVSDHACQLFGGRALTRSGMGQFVEKYQRSFKMQAILGGSEEILADFAIRQAMKSANAKKGTVFAKL